MERSIVFATGMDEAMARAPAGAGRPGRPSRRPDPTLRPTPAPTTALPTSTGAAARRRPRLPTHDGGGPPTAWPTTAAPTTAKATTQGPRPRNLLQRRARCRRTCRRGCHTKPTTAVPTTAAPTLYCRVADLEAQWPLAVSFGFLVAGWGDWKRRILRHCGGRLRVLGRLRAVLVAVRYVEGRWCGYWCFRVQ